MSRTIIREARKPEAITVRMSDGEKVPALHIGQICINPKKYGIPCDERLEINIVKIMKDHVLENSEGWYGCNNSMKKDEWALYFPCKNVFLINMSFKHIDEMKKGLNDWVNAYFGGSSKAAVACLIGMREVNSRSIALKLRKAFAARYGMWRFRLCERSSTRGLKKLLESREDLFAWCYENDYEIAWKTPQNFLPENPEEGISPMKFLRNWREKHEC